MGWRVAEAEQALVRIVAATVGPAQDTKVTGRDDVVLTTSHPSVGNRDADPARSAA